MLIVGVVAFLYFIQISNENKKQEDTIQPDIIESMKAGEVGEIEGGKTLTEANPEAIDSPVRPPDTAMPDAVFDTKGQIISLEEDGVVIMGSGENFEDQRTRELKVNFVSQTITFEKGQQSRYAGLEGLNYLEIGQTILVSSAENIRGKTEFTAAYINKL